MVNKIKCIIKSKSFQKKLMLVVMCVAMFSLMAVCCFAEETTGSGADISGTFSTAITQVKTDFQGFLATALPVALSIAGIGLAITLGWKYFKKLGK